MDISKTSNPFICLAEGLSRRGDDLEEIARDLTSALKACIIEGLEKTDSDTLLAEIKLLGGWSVDDSHRHPVEMVRDA